MTKTITIDKDNLENENVPSADAKIIENLLAELEKIRKATSHLDESDRKESRNTLIQNGIKLKKPIFETTGSEKIYHSILSAVEEQIA